MRSYCHSLSPKPRLLTAARVAAMIAQGLAIPPRAARMCLPEIPCVYDGGERKYRPADVLAVINC
jgi:hypothetical protein